MADDKTKRGSPDSKRLNKSEPYEVAYAKQKAKRAAAKKAAAPTAKKATAKKAGTAAKTAAKSLASKTTAKSAAKSPVRSAGKAPSKTAAPARKAAPRRRMALDGTIPPPAEREKRSRGDEDTVTNTAPAVKREPDAVDLLVDDHLAAYAVFKKYERLADADGSADDRKALATAVCRMLTVHTTIEEEIFYPAARKAGIDADLLDEADIEHQSAKELIAQIESGDPDDDKYDAKVTVLGEYVAHHVKEEHTEMFSKCRKVGMDLVALRAELEARKAALGGDAPEAEPADGKPAKQGLLAKVTGMLG